MSIIPQKHCPKCGNTKPLVDFPRSAQSKDGHYTYCKACLSVRNRAIREKNAESIKAYKAAWHQRNKEQINAHRRQYRQEHAEEYRQKGKQRYAADPESYKRRAQQRYLRNKEQVASYYQDWRRHNRDKTRIIARRYYAKRYSSGGQFSAGEWDSLKQQYDYRCLRCGRQEPEIVLVADHIIPVSKGGHSYIDNIQPLCQPCNSVKRDKVIDYRSPQ